MSNQFRSKAFIKIKQNIQGAVGYDQLETCERMLNCGISLLTRDEILILQDYLITARNLFAPIEMIHEQLKSKSICKSK